jgi:hypothetical protein
LKTKVKRQIELIENGKPLEAFKKFFSDKVIMYNNEAVFSNNKKEGLELQIEFLILKLLSITPTYIMKYQLLALIIVLKMPKMNLLILKEYISKNGKMV